ncbi:Cullin-1 [Porphyridium purpureum]|uniref:Cullin-1 n=1 Tax=Porphyridium purpureum TaxID=35688 RepID=A0A5J4YH06_PORPP|nr:Cullin-1 [Porphyridium purpureum]|eukprot:POR5211..scf250_33
MASGARRGEAEFEAAWTLLVTNGLEPLEVRLEGRSDAQLPTASTWMEMYTTVYATVERPPRGCSWYCAELLARLRNRLCAYLQNYALVALRKEHDQRLLIELARRWDRHLAYMRWVDKILEGYFSARACLWQSSVRCSETNESQQALEVVLRLYFFISENTEYDVYRDYFEEQLVQCTTNYYHAATARWMKLCSTSEYLRTAADAIKSEIGFCQRSLPERSRQRVIEVCEQHIVGSHLDELLFNRQESGLAAMLEQNRQEDLQLVYELYSSKHVKDQLIRFAHLFGEHVAVALRRGRANYQAALVPGPSSSAAGTHGNGSANGTVRIVASTNGGASPVATNAAPRVRMSELKEIDASRLGYTESLLGNFETFLNAVEVVYNSDSSFQESFRIAWISFLNEPVFTFSQDETQNMSCAELLADYCDCVLNTAKSPKLDETEIDTKLSSLVNMTGYLTEKDKFLTFLRTLLAKRLLGEKSNEDTEMDFVEKLKEKFGNYYTKDLQGMITDVHSVREVQTRYKQWLAQASAGAQPLDSDTPSTPNVSSLGAMIQGVDFTVRYLTFSHWPSFQDDPDLVLPCGLSQCVNSFLEFIQTQGRSVKIDWLHARSKCHLVVLCPDGVKMTIVGSVYQTCILKLFDFQDRLTFAEVRKQLIKDPVNQSEANLKQWNQKVDRLKQYLITLSKGPKRQPTLLKCSAKLSVSEIGDEHVFEFNPDFLSPTDEHGKNRKRKVQIQLPLPKLQSAVEERDHVHRALEIERKYVMEAAIVRIMKGAQTLEHANLISAVVSQLMPRFSPDLKQLKLCIETLISREYLERDKNNPSMYKYMA